jgi:hypothetical protein
LFSKSRPLYSDSSVLFSRTFSLGANPRSETLHHLVDWLESSPSPSSWISTSSSSLGLGAQSRLLAGRASHPMHPAQQERQEKTRPHACGLPRKARHLPPFLEHQHTQALSTIQQKPVTCRQRYQLSKNSRPCWGDLFSPPREDLANTVNLPHSRTFVHSGPTHMDPHHRFARRAIITSPLQHENEKPPRLRCLTSMQPRNSPNGHQKRTI